MIPRRAVWLTFLVALAFASLGSVAPTRVVTPAPRLTSETVVPSLACPPSGLTVEVRPRTATPVVHTSAVKQPVAPTGEVRRVRATGYCSCARCCGTEDWTTADGSRTAWGTIAAPRSFAFGSQFTIPEIGGVFTVRDRGGAISGNRIDIWFPTHEEALAWGVRTVTLIPIQ